MEQRNNRKTLYIVISLVVSVLVWFYVNGSTEVLVSVTNVPVEFLNEETSLADKGLMRVDEEEPTIDLKLRMSRNTVFRLDTSKIRAIADLGFISAPGVQSVNYALTYPPNISVNDVKVESPTVRAVSVKIGELSRRTVDVRCKVIGSVADGYLAGSVRMSPNTIEIRGRQEDIISVNYAQVTLNIENATSSIRSLLGYELYDFNDRPIQSNLIHPATDEIEVVLPVMTVKEVPIEVEFVESPGARLSNIDLSLSATSVTLSGDPAQLSAFDKITLDTITLKNLAAQEHFVYPLDIPEGLENLSGITEVTLDLAFKDITTGSFHAHEFTYRALSAPREVTIVTSSLPVTLMGTSEAIEKVVDDDIVVTADLSDVSDAEGVYTVPASVNVKHSADVGAVGEYQVTVQLGALAAEGQEERT